MKNSSILSRISGSAVNRLMQYPNAASLFAKYSVQIKFVLNGTWNTLFAILIFMGLNSMFAHLFDRRYIAYMSAYALTNILSIMNAFVFHKYLTFRSRAKGLRLVTEFIRFFCTYAFVFTLAMALFPVLVEGFHITPNIANVIGIFISMAVSYFAHSRFSFRLKDRIK